MFNVFLIFVIIISTIIIALIFYLFCLIVKKIKKLNSLKVKVEKLQLPELIANKFLICTNYEKINIYQNHKFSNNQPIFVFVHDLIFFEDWFQAETKNLQANIIYFQQRGFKENNFQKKSFAFNISDLKNLLFALKNQYSNKIYVVALGMSWLWVIRLQLPQIVILNPIWDWNKFNFLKATKPNFVFAIFKSLNRIYQLQVFKNFNNQKNKGKIISFNFLYYFQFYRYLNKKKLLFKYLQTHKILILQNIDNFFCNQNNNHLFQKNKNITLIANSAIKINQNLFTTILNNNFNE